MAVALGWFEEVELPLAERHMSGGIRVLEWRLRPVRLLEWRLRPVPLWVRFWPRQQC